MVTSPYNQRRDGAQRRRRRIDRPAARSPAANARTTFGPATIWRSRSHRGRSTCSWSARHARATAHRVHVRAALVRTADGAAVRRSVDDLRGGSGAVRTRARPNRSPRSRTAAGFGRACGGAPTGRRIALDVTEEDRALRARCRPIRSSCTGSALVSRREYPGGGLDDRRAAGRPSGRWSITCARECEDVAPAFEATGRRRAVVAPLALS